MSEWMPVLKANFIHKETQSEFMIDHDRIWVGHVEEDEWIVLPDGLRVCRLVTQSITPAALEAEGWKVITDVDGETLVYALTIGDVDIEYTPSVNHVNLISECDQDGHVDLIDLYNVKTMEDLRTICRLLKVME